MTDKIKKIDPIIRVDHLVKRYHKAKKNAVNDISFEVMPGEFFAFLGPNGAGKTTTISILTTTLAQTSGKVTIAGYDLDHQSKQVRQNVGIIFQNPSLDLDLTAEENIRLHAGLYNEFAFKPAYGLMPEAYKQKVGELAKLVGLESDLFKPMKTFSGGMKRKLEIVRSLMHAPKVLFLDEPTSGLDPVSRNDLWQYLQKVRREHGTTIFLTTHYLDEAEGADRVCVINQGKIMSIGTPTEIKHQISEEFALFDADDRDALRKELQSLGCEILEEKPHFKVRIHDSASAQKLVSRIKSPLNILQISMPSLEEAYIKLIKDEEEQ
jgi:ABC-2 type transport system ATP-binding protein